MDLGCKSLEMIISHMHMFLNLFFLINLISCNLFGFFSNVFFLMSFIHICFFQMYFIVYFHGKIPLIYSYFNCFLKSYSLIHYHYYFISVNEINLIFQCLRMVQCISCSIRSGSGFDNCGKIMEKVVNK